MRVDDIKQRVEEINQCAGDDERAHSMEDSLWEDVLLAIAAGEDNPIDIAKAALATRNIDFSRWCA